MKRKASDDAISPTMASQQPLSASVNPQIFCDRMRQQQEVRVVEDDWTGITDPKLRRRLQNRLNQRAKRKREVGTTQKKAFPDQKLDDLMEPAVRSVAKQNDLEEVPQQQLTVIDELERLSPGRPVRMLPKLCNLKPRQALKLMHAYEQWLRNKSLRSLNPSADLLLTMMQYNTMRAFILNTYTLGLTMEWLDEDAISPFSGAYASRPEGLYPSSLRPTAMQKKVMHHPWIDLFPHAQMRDNLLERQDTYDEDQLCEDLVGWCAGPQNSCNLAVWKEPWDISGWEVSETFIKAWPWVVAGCTELLQSTNFWRASRGEAPLRFEEVS